MKTFMKTIAILICVLCMGAASITVKASAAVPNAVKPNAGGRYILSATVTDEAVMHVTDLDENELDLLYCFFEDCNGESWCYAYEMDNLNAVPPMYQSVILVMNCNGTPDDIDDDIVEDVLWCNCESAAEED